MLRTIIHAIAVLVLCSQVASAQVGTPVPPPPSNTQVPPYVAPNPATSQSRVIPGIQQDLRCRMQWGLTAMPLPAYLRAPQLNLLPGQGLLVTSVDPYSAAQRAGIQPGFLILDVDGQVVTAQTGLPHLEESCTVSVLTDQGTLGLSIRPHAAFHSGAQSPSWLSQSVQTMMEQQLALASAGIPGMLGTGQRTPSCIRSLSVNRLGDDIICSAIVRGDTGLERLYLQGSPEEVECQLGKLTPELQQALRPQLGF